MRNDWNAKRKGKAASRAIALLAAAALPAIAAAQDKVEFFGLIDAFGGSVKTNGHRATVVNSGGMTTSFWGIRGSEDVGNGLKVVFALEDFIRNDTGQQGRFNGDPFFSRDAYVGFAGDFGSVTLGRNTAPYFVSTLVFNPFGDSFTFGPMITHTFRSDVGTGLEAVQGDTGLSNSIRWTSPVMSNFKADLAMSAGSERDVAPTGTNRALDASLYWFGGALTLGVAFRDINLDTGNGRDEKALQVGASYDLKAAKLFVQYQHARQKESAVPALDVTHKTFQLGASVPAGPGVVLVSWARSKIDDQDATIGDKRSTWALGYDYNLSKRTDVYAALYDDRFSNPTSFKQQVLGLGIRHRF